MPNPDPSATNTSDPKTPENKDLTTHCVCCDRPETIDDCVQCDQCNGWWHMMCAEVSASVADRSWTCGHCLPLSVSSRTTTSSVRLARLALKKKQLEEQHAMEQRHLAEKYKLMEEELNEMDETSSNRSRMSRRTSLEKVKLWQRKYAEQSGDLHDIPADGRQAAGDALCKQGTNDRGDLAHPSYVEESTPTPPAIKGPHERAEVDVNRLDSVQRGRLNAVVIEARQESTLYKPPLNSTVKSLSIPGLNNAKWQHNTGTIPKQQKVINNPGKTDPQIPPEAHQGKPLFDHTTSTSLPPKSENSLQQIIKQFGSLAPSTMLAYNRTNMNALGTNTLPPSGTSTGFVPQANLELSSGSVPPPAEQPNVGNLPQANSISHSVSVPPLVGLQTVGSSPQVNPGFSIGTVPPPPGLPIVENFTPSPSQLAARQVMSRELPTFSGDPADWPIFISSFMNSTLACGYNSAENLARLQRCLKGHAYESVKSRLLLPESVPSVIETLRLLYGRPELLISALLQNVRSVPAPKPEKLESIIDFGLAVRSLCDHLEAAGQQEHLSNPTLLMEMVEKLPAHTKLQWADYMQQHPLVNLKTFGDFMLRVITSVSRVTMYVGGNSSDQHKTKQKGVVYAHTSEAELMHEPVFEQNRVCFCCKKPGHRVAECSIFKAYSVDDRWKFVQSKGLCRSCLNSHGRRSCKNATQCVFEGCQYRHHPLLHSNRSENVSERSTQGLSTVQNHIHRQFKQALLFRIIPVVVSGPRATIETFAFLDDGSDLSLIESSLVDQLGIDGWKKPLCLKWTGNVTRIESESKHVRVMIRGINSQQRFSLNDIRTVQELTLPEQSLNYDELSQRYRYLQGLPVDSYDKAVPRLLIGVNNANLTVPLQVREGRKDEPIAVRTRLGWCIFGGRGNRAAHSLNYHACECSNDQDLHNTVKEYFAMEDAGVKSPVVLESVDDNRARKIMEQTTVRRGDWFETGLIWKYDVIEFPDSYNMAVKRLECLERRMMRDPTLATNLKNQIMEYQLKGYAHRATEEELSQADPKRVWYLPLGAVTNPRKPGKVRLIWDAAAKVDGISLNSMLLKGPDQLTSLPAVLSRFRQYPVGVSADIKEMFHQLLIRPTDRHSQRFVFRNNPADPVDIYLMDVATFGSTCSPASAQFVKNQNAEAFVNIFPRAVEGIVDNHYVDDYLDSFENEDEAERVSREVRSIHQKGGFLLRNWLSNSTIVLHGQNEEEQKKTKCLYLSGLENSDRVLGMLWKTTEDELWFPMIMKDEVQKVIESGERPTKRQMLRCLMGIFDPLGLLSVFLVHGKILLQDVWRTGLQWDEKVPERIFERWIRWISLFPEIGNLRIPRCYFKGASAQMYGRLQLHIFVDASEAAFSAVAYFRVVNAEGNPECSIVAAKTKVAPLKPLSIPRLELQAAVLGSRLMSFVQKSHRIEVKQRFMWSDSATVLAWLRSDHRRYKQYVACRIGELLSTTDVEEWRWVPTKLNPADAATKWGKNACPKDNDEWFKGPKFLRLSEEEWPKQTSFPIQSEEELRPCFMVQEVIIPESVVDFSRFSKWRKLLGAIAYTHRFVDNCRRKHRGEAQNSIYLSPEELRRAKNTVVRAVQWQEFPDEMITLSRGQIGLPKTSSLYQLTPTIDECGVLRVDGRIGAAPNTAFDSMFPVILPRKHLVTNLVTEDFHRAFHHGNSETVVNEIRQFYHISRLRTVVKQVAKACQWCKVKKATPKIPRMAPLPVARLSSYSRPFTYTGIDFFGPLLVKVGRSAAKRWICIFTCLTIRAVHVEVAHSLSTSSCMSCIRRFVCRRGAPAEIYTDNGTNFQGAERLLKEQLLKMHDELAATYTNTDTKWIFIPPGAPHMGGVWERMVRSIKSAMETAYNSDRKLDDEGLATLVVEAEGIVNSRPLTYQPLDAAEGEALTPNHFLLGSSRGVRQPAIPFNDPAVAVKNSWNLIQHQLDVFWKRWIREYLPMLTKRMKWFGEVTPIAEGDLVLIVDDGRRNGWIRGRVKDVLVAADGRIRQATVQTARGILRRPVSKLAVLEVELGGKTGTDGQCYGGEDVAASTAPQC